MFGINQLRLMPAHPRVAQPHHLMRTPYIFAFAVALLACTPPTSQYDDPWFNPPGGTWVPDRGVVSQMKVALNDELRPILEKRADSGMPSKRYWFQYIGNGSGVDRTIGIVGRPFPVPSGAEAVFLGAVVPEQCHVFASYQPNERRFKEVAVGGFHCPPRI